MIFGEDIRYLVSRIRYKWVTGRVEPIIVVVVRDIEMVYPTRYVVPPRMPAPGHFRERIRDELFARTRTENVVR